MRSLNLDQLRAFVEVVTRGSFTAAAKELNLTQPAVTHQIQELEKRFNTVLVERLGKRAHLTHAGEKLIEHARQLLDDDRRAQASMRRFVDGGIGRVRIGTSMTMMMYALPAILRKLKTEHPLFEINLKAGLTRDTLRGLKSNTLDLGICALPVDSHGFDTVPLIEDELVAIVPESFGPVPKTVTPAFLARCPLILGNQDSALHRVVADWLSRSGPPPKPVMTFDNVEAIKSVVAVGLGASVVPSLCLGVGHVSMANTIVAPLSPRAARKVGLVQVHGKRPTEAMQLVTAALMTLHRGKNGGGESSASS
jgi:DNA-binding transcriptional LysR family regulator